MTQDVGGSWFAVGIFLKGCHMDSPSVAENPWEERIVLVQAGSSSEASTKAAEWGAVRSTSMNRCPVSGFNGDSVV